MEEGWHVGETEIWHVEETEVWHVEETEMWHVEGGRARGHLVRAGEGGRADVREEAPRGRRERAVRERGERAQQPEQELRLAHGALAQRAPQAEGEAVEDAGVALGVQPREDA